MCDLHSVWPLSVSLGLADHIPGLKGNLCCFQVEFSNGSGPGYSQTVAEKGCRGAGL